MRPGHAPVAAALLLLVLSSLPSAWAASEPGDKIDEYVQSELRDQKVPGLSIAVVRNGEIIKAQGYGLANVELNVPVTPETIFQSGSVGKQFTATLAMMLVEEGKLSLDDPISKYIADAPAIWQGITLRHLMTHTSGLSNTFTTGSTCVRTTPRTSWSRRSRRRLSIFSPASSGTTATPVT